MSDPLSFLAYSGKCLDVTMATDALLEAWFPEINRQSEFREIDSWLYHAPPRKRPKNIRRFLRNWFSKAKRQAEREALREAYRQRELRVGEFRR